MSSKNVGKSSKGKQSPSKGPKKTPNKKSQDKTSGINVNTGFDNVTENSSNPLTIEEEFQTKTTHEHILLVPGMYVGGMSPDVTNMDVFDSVTQKIVNRKIEYVPGLYKIFDEAIVNARDHSVKDGTMTEIRIDIDQTEGSISVYNNGNKGIPVEMHADWGCYVPEGVFTNFMTSGNFHRTNKTIGAKNGYGVKLVAVMSSHVDIEVVDSSNKKKFTMTLTNNMYDKTEPVITTLRSKNIQSYVKVKFIPDYPRFSLPGLTDDMISLFTKRVYDIAAVTNVKVFLNNKHINIKSFSDYIKMFYAEGVSCPLIYEQVNDCWKVGVVFDSEPGFLQKSYVNGICTFQGGTHVNHVVDGVVSKLHEVISAKNKSLKIKTSTIKDNLTFFVDAIIDDPDFPSQTKEYMNSKISTFGSKCIISADFIEMLRKTGITEEVIKISKAKEQNELNVNNGKKKAILRGVEKLEDATDAGTRYSRNCTLILTEGDSAKSFAVAGSQKLGQDKYGVFPLKGKLLNVRNATTYQLKNNEEIINIVQIMGLKYNTVYEDVGQLRYGRILVLTDQDLDGSHIKGLVMNFIDYHWPSLSKMKGFITSMKTPLLKVWKQTDKKKQWPIIFYSQQEFDLWKETNNIKLYTAPKYYKGLATSKEKDAFDAFSEFETKIIFYGDAENEHDRDIIKNVFEGDSVSFRKQWLGAYDKDAIISPNEQNISFHDFANKDMIHFAKYNVERSTPSLCDGLKPSLRKILFTAFKENLINKEVRVSELAGFTIGKACYHHGEASLQKAIIGMAQDFVGSNNINWLMPNGDFGNRREGGHNAGSPRYIYTQLNSLTVSTFRKEDMYVLAYTHDDNGKNIEPETYAPVICNILVNGTKGIGTGFSTTIPCYNPIDIISNQKLLIAGQEPVEMMPWYRGFKGRIEKNIVKGQVAYDVYGSYEPVNENTIIIDELPIGLWTDDYKVFLDTITCDDIDKAEKHHLLSAWTNKCGNNTIHFTLTFINGKLQELLKTHNVDKKLDLVRKLSITNMHLFDAEGKLKKYATVEEILRDFYNYRLGIYVKRKEYYTKVLENKLNLISWKIKFIELYLIKKIVMDINGKSLKEEDVIKQLVDFDFPKLSNNINEGDEEEEKGDKSYDYLTNIKLFDLTEERKAKLREQLNEKQAEYDAYVNMTVNEIWLDELGQIETEHNKQMEEIDEDNLAGTGTKGKGNKKKGAKGKPMSKGAKGKGTK